MVFVHPHAWWLLLVVIPIVALHARNRMGLGKGRAVAVTSLRTAALVLLVAALARPVIPRPDERITAVAVVDTSASVAPADLAPVRAFLEESRQVAGHDVEIVLFADAARSLSSESTGLDDALKDAAPAALGSDLARGLMLAGSLVPHDGRGRVCLFTDGWENAGDALLAASRLADRGIPVDVAPLEAPRAEVVLRALELPPFARVGATVELAAIVEASQPGSARLIVSRPDEDDEVQSVTLSGSAQRFTFPCVLREAGLARYHVRVESANDTDADNNELTAAIAVGGPLHVCVVEDEPASAASAALAAMLGPAGQVHAAVPAEVASAACLDDADVLVLGDVPHEALPDTALTSVADAVRGGLGFLATGGRRAFGAGGYADTPLADVLPVRFSQESERRDPSTTLVIVIDTSGSMGGPRVNLAKEIARLAIARLKPHDKVGIVEFYGSKRWAAPIQPASNAIDLQRALNRLSSGGGTVILPAIEEAFYALQNVRTRTKHVLVLTDGGVEPGAFEPLIRQMADHGITVSTVLVGPGLHSAFLANLAQWGRGRFYNAPDRFNLPEIIVKQPESSVLPPFVEIPTEVRAVRTSPVLGDAAHLPPLDGYAITEPRPTAEVLLASAAGHPVLATWQFGLGRVGVLTTHLGGEWSASWAQEPACGAVVSNLVRWLARPDADSALQIEPTVTPAGVRLSIENILPAGADSFAPLRLVLRAEGSDEQVQSLEPIAPHRWEAWIPALPAGSCAVEAKLVGSNHRGAASVAVPPPREVPALGVNQALFDDLAAIRKIAERRAEQLAKTNPTSPRELWPLLVALVLALFLANVLVRRWPARVRLAGATLALLALFVGADAARAAEPTPSLPDEARAILTTLPHLADEAEREAAFQAACRIVRQRDGHLHALINHLQQANSNDALTRRLLARAAWSDGDLALARQTLDAAATSFPDDPRVQADLARAAELTGDAPAALQAIEAAWAAEKSSLQRLALCVREALLAYSVDNPERAATALGALLTEQPEHASIARYAAHLAAQGGDYALAVELLDRADPDCDFHDHLFLGLWRMRLGRCAEAELEFAQAAELAPLARDRRYAIEQVAAAARCGDRLPALVDAWLADPNLPPERLSTLVGLLRELGRSQEALSLLKRQAGTPEQQAVLESPEFQREIVALAVESGHAAEAEAAYRSLLARYPQEVEWRSGLARLLLLASKKDEAKALFDEAIAAANDPSELLRLADAARRLHLDEAALAAAEKAGRQNASAKVRAILFEAELSRQRGDADRAGALLHELARLGEKDDRVLLAAAEALERHGDSVTSLALYRELDRRGAGEDVRMRLAGLLENAGRLDEALTRWQELWQSTTVPARRRQAQDRLLDLAARTGKLADLAIELEDKLQQGRGSTAELELLVDVYTKANDPVSAAEILFEFSRNSGDEIGALQRLAQVYLRCEQFGRCHRILRRLSELDPANVDEYLSQIAIIAIERRQPAEALAALAELERSAKDRTVADELSAGVLELLGEHTEAAARYDRLLAAHPDRIEALLLWGNALAAAGEADRAVARFQVLVEEAAEDDLFTVAVDGLLNLQAKPAALEAALRRVQARIAAHPEKVFLHQLAVDLHEALGRPARMQEALEQSVVVAGERRGAILRELMEAAKLDGQSDRVIAFGRTLLGLGEEMPPQVFLDLGEALLKSGQLAVAERVFERAAVGADQSAIRQRVANYYEDAGLYAAADRVLRELLIAEPDNVALLLHSGDLRGYLGQFDDAAAQFRTAASLLISRLPRAVAIEEDRPAAGSAPRRERAANLSEIEQYLGNAIGGLLEAARMPQAQASLLAELQKRVADELKAVQASTPGPTLQAHPRLAQLARLVRRVAFALHDPEAADRLDRELLRIFPGDQPLRRELVEARWSWGLAERAAGFPAELDDFAASPVEAQVFVLLADAARLEETLAKGDIRPELAVRLIPHLVLENRGEEARRALRSVATSAVEDWAELAPRMIAAARALDDEEARRMWVEAWLSAALRNGARKDAARTIENCLVRLWGELSDEERSSLPARLAAMVENSTGDGRLALQRLRLRLARGLGRPLDDEPAVRDELAGDPATPASLAAELLDAAPAEARVELLGRLVAARKPAALRAFLFELAANLREPADPAFVEAFSARFKAAPRPRVEAQRAYASATAGNWMRNRRQGELVRQLGETLLSESPNDLIVLSAVAAARRTAGQYEQAVLLVDEAFEIMLAASRPEAFHRLMVRDLVSLLEPADLARMIEQVVERIELEGPTPMLHFVAGELFEAARPARRHEAAAAYRAAYELDPGNSIVSRKLINYYREQGRGVELTRLLATHLAKSTIMESLEWRTLAEIYGELFDLENAERAARKDESPLGPIQVMAAVRLQGRTDEVAATFRRMITRLRNQQRFFEPFWPQEPSPGGLRGHFAEKGRSRLDQPRMYEALADLPFAGRECRALLTAAEPQRRDAQGLARGVALAALHAGEQDALLAELAEAASRDALVHQDQLLLAGLLDNPPSTLPGELASALTTVQRRSDPADVKQLAALARTLGRLGRPDAARRVCRWTVELDAALRPAGMVRDRVSRLEGYLALVPEDQRHAERARLLAAWAASPLEEPAGEVEAARLRALTDAADAEVWLAELERAERFFAEAPSLMRYAPWVDEVARAQALAGRLDAFQATVARRLSERDRNSFVRQTFDPTDLLPPAGRLADAAAYVAAIEAALSVGAALRDEDFTASLALLGHWCIEAGLTQQARALLEKSIAAAGEPGAHWLFPIDLADALGEEDRATQMAVQLAEQDLLPVVRLVPLLEKLAATDALAAATLARRAATYSNHPEILRHAKTEP